MKRVFAIALTAVLVTVALPAYTQAAAPTPPVELQKIAYLAGTWNAVFSAGGGPKMTSIEENHWMDGGFFLIMHSKSSGGTSSIALMGYDADAKKYTYDEYDNRGSVDHSIGTIEGDTWTWRDRFKKGAQPYEDRFVMKILSPTSYTFKYETSANGTDWKTELEGTSTKAK